MTSTTNPTRREAARARKRRQRDREREQARQAKIAAAIEQERRDELIAPAAQRQAVTALDGSVVRAARLVRDGVGFRRADPLAHIAAEVDGGSKAWTAEHLMAAKRLRDAWDIVGEGTGLAASDWGRIQGGAECGMTAPPGHADLLAQVQARVSLEAAATFLGALWPAIRDMMLVGMSMTAWSKASGIEVSSAKGYLRAALDRLVEHYAPRAEAPQVARIRVLGPGREAYSTEVDGE